jgi:hypothetical protein
MVESGRMSAAFATRALAYSESPFVVVFGAAPGTALEPEDEHPAATSATVANVAAMSDTLHVRDVGENMMTFLSGCTGTAAVRSKNDERCLHVSD